METVLFWVLYRSFIVFINCSCSGGQFFPIAVEGIFFPTVEINSSSFKFENRKKVFVHIIQ